MATRLYLHNATSSVSGTLPSAEQSSKTSVDDWEAQTVNHDMSRFKGTSGVTLSNSSLASTGVKDCYCAKFVSPVLNQTSIAANTWTIEFSADSTSGGSNHLFPDGNGATNGVGIYLCMYVWKPSNGTKYGNICDGPTSTSGSTGTSPSEYLLTISGSAVSSLTSGDAVIVCELWFSVNHLDTTSYTERFYMDGTVVGGAGSAQQASYISTPENLSISDGYTEVKLYLHNTTSGIPSGTLPSAEQSTKTVTSACNFEGSQTTNRLMDSTIGASQATLSLTTPANTSANTFYVSRWVSPVIYQTSVAAGTWTYNFAAKEPSTSANFPVTANNKAVWVNCYVWKPSNGTKYGTILDGNTAATISEGSGALEQSREAEFTGATVSSLTSGDAIIVFEAWFAITQGSAAPFTDEFFYDGTTENAGGNITVSNHASFIKTNGMALAFTGGATNFDRALPTETVSISESLTEIYGANRSLATETITIGESLGRSVTNTRTLTTETSAISEVLNRVYGANRALATETVVIGENQNRVYGANRSLSDTVIVSENLARVQSLIRILSETVPISENLSRVYGVNRSLSETVIIGDNLARAVANVRSLAIQTTAISESLTKQVSLNRSLIDTVIIIENLTRVFGINRALSDTVVIGESLSRTLGANRASTDTVPITESLAKMLVLVRAISQTVAISENVNRAVTVVRILSETVPISESVSRTINEGLATFSRSLTETVNISENLTRVVTNVRNLTETTPISETLARVLASNRSLTETIIISENLARVYGVNRSLAQTVAISESLTRTLGINRSLIENIPTSESLIRSIIVNRTLLESTPISESLARSEGFNRALTETVIINEVLTKVFTAVRNLLETVPITESLSKSQQVSRNLVENTSISEVLTRNIVVTRTLFEVVTILDNLQTVLIHFVSEDYVPSLLTDFSEDIGKMVTDWMRDKWNIGDPHI